MNTIKYIILIVLIFLHCGDGRRKKKNKQNRQEDTPAAQPDAVIAAACTTTCLGDSQLDQRTCECTCATGYQYNRGRQRCEDINECSLYPDRCLGNCYNRRGSFECICPSGYVIHKNGWDCRPEPKVLPCGGLVCYDGSRLNTVLCKCECENGYRYNFYTEQCDDINECILGTHGCGHGCINVPRGYKCYCPEGYVLSSDVKQCSKSVDSNRELPCDGKVCGTGSSLDAHHCKCECQIGYTYDIDENACVDIDECYDYRGWCGGTCINNIGSYQCICSDGYQINEDGWTCDPIPTPDPGDEICGDYDIKCDNGHCVQDTVVCDGYDDCGDGTDEQNCKNICPAESFQCANGAKCLDKYDLCDSENDCGDFSDEEYCKCQDEKLQCRAWERRGECDANPGWMNWNCRLTCEVCLTTDGVPSGKIDLHSEPEQYYIRNSHEFANQMQFVLRNAGERPGTVGNQWSCDNITSVPTPVKEDFRLSGLYTKYTEAFKIPILGTSLADDDAMKRACYVIRFMLGDRRDLRQTIYKKWGRVAIMDGNEYTQNVPEHSHTDRIMRGVRGLGGTLHIPVTSVGEENLLCRSADPNRGEDILIHNFAHALQKISIRVAQPNFQERLALAYNKARRRGLWENTKADDTVEEYFAEGVQIFFNVQHSYKYGVHNDIDTRDKLGRYDPELHDLITEVFPCMNHIVDRCADQADILKQPLKMNCKDAHRVRLTPTQVPTTPIQRNDEDLPSDCQDSDGDCFDWAIAGECEENPGWMHMHCRRSCRTCRAEPESIDPSLACTDELDECKKWANHGRCTTREDKLTTVNYMKIFCKKSCQYC
ncbi:uncharacterized protein [Amphiura filiformis]|uniref:uncharacterized protein isoform X2 n=1 Tax=Amphiura filiformis TaxID=82378 RepID=UPI003B20E5E9